MQDGAAARKRSTKAGPGARRRARNVIRSRSRRCRSGGRGSRGGGSGLDSAVEVEDRQVAGGRFDKDNNKIIEMTVTVTGGVGVGVGLAVAVAVAVGTAIGIGTGTQEERKVEERQTLRGRQRLRRGRKACYSSRSLVEYQGVTGATDLGAMGAKWCCHITAPFLFLVDIGHRASRCCPCGLRNWSNQMGAEVQAQCGKVGSISQLDHSEWRQSVQPRDMLLSNPPVLPNNIRRLEEELSVRAENHSRRLRSLARSWCTVDRSRIYSS